MKQPLAKFHIGQVVEHKLFHYRGVIIDVDATFLLTEEWYELMAKSRPPKDKPWYSVLVHNSNHFTYVAEQNLEPDKEGGPIKHPDIWNHFSGFDRGVYQLRKELKFN